MSRGQITSVTSSQNEAKCDRSKLVLRERNETIVVEKSRSVLLLSSLKSPIYRVNESLEP